MQRNNLINIDGIPVFVDALTSSVGGQPPNQIPVPGEQIVIPYDIKESLMTFRNEHPYQTKVAFIMMQFGNTKDHDRILDAIRDTLTSHRITGLRADDKQYHDDVFSNIKTYMHGCSMGIAVFERIQNDDFNPNVSLEIGYMMALNKPVCLLKESTLRALHTDLTGKLYKGFDRDNIQNSINEQLTKWLEDKGFIQA